MWHQGCCNKNCDTGVIVLCPTHDMNHLKGSFAQQGNSALFLCNVFIYWGVSLFIHHESSESPVCRQTRSPSFYENTLPETKGHTSSCENKVSSFRWERLLCWPRFNIWNQLNLQPCLWKQNPLPKCFLQPSNFLSHLHNHLPTAASHTPTDVRMRSTLHLDPVWKLLFSLELQQQILEKTQQQPVSSQAEAAWLAATCWSKSQNPAACDSFTTCYVSAWSLGLKDAVIPVLVL